MFLSDSLDLFARFSVRYLVYSLGVPSLVYQVQCSLPIATTSYANIREKARAKIRDGARMKDHVQTLDVKHIFRGCSACGRLFRVIVILREAQFNSNELNILCAGSNFCFTCIIYEFEIKIC